MALWTRELHTDYSTRDDTSPVLFSSEETHSWNSSSCAFKHPKQLWIHHTHKHTLTHQPMQSLQFTLNPLCLTFISDSVPLTFFPVSQTSASYTLFLFSASLSVFSVSPDLFSSRIWLECTRTHCSLSLSRFLSGPVSNITCQSQSQWSAVTQSDTGLLTCKHKSKREWGGCICKGFEKWEEIFKRVIQWCFLRNYCT